MPVRPRFMILHGTRRRGHSSFKKQAGKLDGDSGKWGTDLAGGRRDLSAFVRGHSSRAAGVTAR